MSPMRSPPRARRPVTIEARGHAVLGADLGRRRRPAAGPDPRRDRLARRSGGGSGRRWRRPDGGSSRSTCPATDGRGTGPADRCSARRPPTSPRSLAAPGWPRRISRSSRTAGARWCRRACRPSGIRPATLVLLDPPTISLDADRPRDRRRNRPRMAGVTDPVAAIGAARPDWTAGRRRGGGSRAARGRPGGRAGLLLSNGDWDCGLAELAGPAAAGLDVRVVRGEPATGGRMPDAGRGDLRRALRRRPRHHDRRRAALAAADAPGRDRGRAPPLPGRAERARALARPRRIAAARSYAAT